ncbi:hypothetical protein Srubr_79870 [Streptomyces rubradiris]|uniref:Uncharacterized protein n=1 Tax=Streptomyces rubradiris TaxID=285531 RepID=A0ABQ3RQJ0_STRRR|nr:hypothetical protein Srubr_79870 [Streptomyces rubradiris]
MVDSPVYVESPRLWYIAGSLSQAGTLAWLVALGVWGKEPVPTGGNFPVPSAWSASSKGRPSSVR